MKRGRQFSQVTGSSRESGMFRGGGGGIGGGRRPDLASEGHHGRTNSDGDGSGSGGLGQSNRGTGDGLDPNRVRGFGMGQRRVETPSLNDMRARQGAIVAKFMTFFKRKNSLVVEMYETSFYRQKPSWDKIADFIHNDLCTTSELRRGVQDVQFHPVKMLIFVRFTDEKLRDEAVARLQSPAGVIWGDYKVKVKGYSLDAQVKFVRLLGVSPETGEKEIKETFLNIGIGEVIEIKKGFLDAGRLPGVTNGTWSLRVKILDPDKVIPSYIHRRDEGELWSLNFEGRVFCCWKCGSGTHIGDKCRDQTRTFDEIFGGVDTDVVGGESLKPTWAAVVRSGQGVSEEERIRLEVMERKLKEDNMRKDREMQELENQKKLEEEEKERRRQKNAEDIQKAVEKAASDAHMGGVGGDDTFADSVDDQELVEFVAGDSANVSQVPVYVSEAGLRACLTAAKHIAWMQKRSEDRRAIDSLSIVVNSDLERVFRPGPLLAIEHHVGENVPQDDPGGFDSGVLEKTGMGVPAQHTVSDDEDLEGPADSAMVTSSPKERRSRRRKRGKGSGDVSARSPSPVRSSSESDSVYVEMDLMKLGSSFITSGSGSGLSDSGENDSKKLKLDGAASDILEDMGGGSDSSDSQKSIDHDGLMMNLEAELVSGKGEGSSRSDESSSGVSTLGCIFPPGASGGEGPGQL